MKKIMRASALAVLALALFTSTAQAGDFFGGNDGEWKMGPNGPYWDESDWPEWTPMYWMEEFMDALDDDDDYGGYGGGYGGGYRGMPYNGGGYPTMPYGGGYGYPSAPYSGGNAPTHPVPVAPIPPRL